MRLCDRRSDDPSGIGAALKGHLGWAERRVTELPPRIHLTTSPSPDPELVVRPATTPYGPDSGVGRPVASVRGRRLIFWRRVGPQVAVRLKITIPQTWVWLWQLSDQLFVSLRMDCQAWWLYAVDVLGTKRAKGQPVGDGT